jgi:hypothetical protein
MGYWGKNGFIVSPFRDESYDIVSIVPIIRGNTSTGKNL